MEFTDLFLVALAGAILASAAFVIWRLERSTRSNGVLEAKVQSLALGVDNQSQAAPSIANLRVENAKLRTNLENAWQTVEETRMRASNLERQKEELKSDLSRVEIARTKAITEKDAAVARLRDVEAMDKRGKDWLRNIASEALELETKQFAEMIKPFEKKIEEFEKNNAREQGKFEEQIRTLAETSGALASALTGNPQKRGRWMEIQFEQFLEHAGLIEPVSFETQVQVPGGRIDVVLKLPGGRKLIVDSKLPLLPYLQASDEKKSPEERAHHLKDLVKSVDQHAIDLAGRQYPTKLKNSAKTVFMVIPDEVLQAAVAEDPYILQRHAENDVLVVGFVGLCTAAKAVALSWEQAETAKTATEAVALGKELHKRMAKFAEHLEKARKGLNTAVTFFNKAMRSFRTRLEPAARELAARGLSANNDEVEFSGIEAPLDPPMRAGLIPEEDDNGIETAESATLATDKSNTDDCRASHNGETSSAYGDAPQFEAAELASTNGHLVGATAGESSHASSGPGNFDKPDDEPND